MDLPELKKGCLSGEVINAEGWIVYSENGLSKDQAAEIIRRVKAYENLLEISQIAYEALCTGDQEATDKAIGMIENFKQALEREPK